MNALPDPLVALALVLVLGGLILVVVRLSRERSLDRRGLLVVGLVLVVVAIGSWVFFLAPPGPKEIPYGGSPGSFLGLVKAGEVSKVVQQGTRLTITPLGRNATETIVSQVPSELTNLVADIGAACAEPGAVPDCVSKVEISAEEPSQTGQLLTLLLTALLPVILIGAIFYFMVRQARGQGSAGLGGSARRSTRERLEELENLRSKGTITEEEYATKRKQILDDL